MLFGEKNNFLHIYIIVVNLLILHHYKYLSALIFLIEDKGLDPNLGHMNMERYHLNPHRDEFGEVCPANWNKTNKATIKTDPIGKLEFFEKQY